jgi:hypothetical protein
LGLIPKGPTWPLTFALGLISNQKGSVFLKEDFPQHYIVCWFTSFHSFESCLLDNFSILHVRC